MYNSLQNIVLAYSKLNTAVIQLYYHDSVVAFPLYMKGQRFKLTWN